MAGWFRKKILNLGPGSPGYTAKALAELYLDLHEKGEKSNDGIFSVIIGRRIMSWRMGGITPEGVENIGISDIVELSDDDLTSLTFFLMYMESRTFRNNVMAHPDTFDATTKVIYDNILQIAPVASNKSLSEFRNVAKQFIKDVYN